MSTTDPLLLSRLIERFFLDRLMNQIHASPAPSLPIETRSDWSSRLRMSDCARSQRNWCLPTLTPHSHWRF